MAAVQSADTPRHCAASALGDEIAVLCSRIYAAEARLLDRIARFDAADYAVTLGLPSTAHWLNYQCGIGMNAARERVRVATALEALPLLRAAFAEGRLSYSKVRALTRIADASNETYLLEFAHYGTAHHVERLVAKSRWVERLNDPERTRRRQAERYLSIRYDEDGSMLLRGRLPAEQGELIKKALEYWLDREEEEIVRAEENPPADTSNPPAEESEPLSARRADALAGMAERFLAHPGQSGSTADRYQVVVHVAAPADNPPAETQHSCQPESAESIESATKDQSAITGSDDSTQEGGLPPALMRGDDSGIELPRDTARRIACDASVVAIREDDSGQPLSVGRKTRSIPPAIRRALLHRDGGCRFPGCTRSRHVDGHHIRHWADGGETSLDNLVLLCRFHHRLVHEGGFSCTRSDDGEIRFEDAGHNPMPVAASLPGLDESLDAWLERQFFELDIDATTPMAKLTAGEESVDWDMAIAPLFSD